MNCLCELPYTLKLNCVCCVVTERDVSRTDRHNTFFSGNDNPGLTLLHDVLMTYCMYNFDLGEDFWIVGKQRCSVYWVLDYINNPPPPENIKIKTFCGLQVTFRSWRHLLGDLSLQIYPCHPDTVSLHPGYVQGMSDLLSPILFVTQNEVESFWCLTGFMELLVSRNISLLDFSRKQI